MDLSIIGAGDSGRELHSWIKSDKDCIFEIIKFVDPDIHILNDYNISIDVVSDLNNKLISNCQYYLIGITDSIRKRHVYNEIIQKKVNLQSYVYCNVLIGLRVNIDSGVIIFPNVVISNDVSISKCVFININSLIGHDVFIGEFTSIMSNVNIGGGVSIGNNVFIATGAILLPYISIADNVRIGAGTVVIKSIKKPGTYFGNPAKKIF